MSLLSCKRFTERHTRSLDAPLKGWDRFAYRFHYLLCYVCRRFSQQILYLERVLKLVGQQEREQIIGDSQESKLSLRCCELIKQKLDEASKASTPKKDLNE